MGKEIAKQVCHIDKDGSFAFDRWAIESIFGQPVVAESPIAVISMTGETRTGKSFLLNLLASYFAKLEIGEQRQWRKDLTANVNTMFQWRGGVDVQTKGIWISRKPHWITLDDGVKIALFLMDSEGLFSTTASSEETACLFAMSTLFSSYRILNVERQLTSSQLQAFQDFSDYQQVFGEREVKSEPLLILLRDWNGRKTGYGFRPGDDYMKTKLESSDLPMENRAATAQFLSAFSRYACYALPEPGSEIRHSDDQISSDYTMQDVGEKFLEKVEELAETLSREITPKKCGWNVLKGKDMSSLANFCAKKLKSPDANMKKSFLEGKLEYELAEVFTKCLKELNTTLKEKCSEHLDENAKHKIKGFCSREAKRRFQDACNSTNRHVPEKTRLFDQLVENHILEFFDNMESANRHGGANAIYSYKVRYNMKMRAILEERFTGNLFEIHSEYKQEILGDLAEAIYGNLDRDNGRQLEQVIEQSYKRIWEPRNEMHYRVYARPASEKSANTSVSGREVSGAYSDSARYFLFALLVPLFFLLLRSGTALIEATLYAAKATYRSAARRARRWF